MMKNEAIVEKIRNGVSVTDYMQTLYEKNLPLIKKIVKPYAVYECEADLLQEAYFGLLEAVKHYEASENVLFMTYAKYWIRSSAQRYLKKGACLYRVSSLDMPLSGCEGTTIADTVQDTYSLENDVIDKMYAEHSENELWGIVERYTDNRENAVIKEIFINNRTMAAVAREQGVPFSRIRQIKDNALRKLRRGKAGRELMQKFDIAEKSLYRGGSKNYREHDFTSVVEYIAIRKIEAEKRYKKHLAEIEDMRTTHNKPRRGVKTC